MNQSLSQYFTWAASIAALFAAFANPAFAQAERADELDFRGMHGTALGGVQLPSDAQIQKQMKPLNLPSSEELQARGAYQREKADKALSQAGDTARRSAFKPVREAATEQERAAYASGLAQTQGALAAKVQAAQQGKQGLAGMVDPAQADRLQQLLKQHESVKQKLANQMKSGTISVPEDALLIFVSFSMPEQVLKNLAEQARVAGGVMVLRGMVDGKLSATQAAALRVNQGRASWEINPELFTTFDVNTVPAFVLTGNKAVLDEGCAPDDSGQCSPKNTFSKVSGDISVQAALDTMRLRTEIPFIRDLAQTRLKNFGRE
jgi:type-F conjugative transfer system pilin assembly protein TrbC